MSMLNRQFAERLRLAMQKAGYEVRPSVLEREFNTRYWGKPMTLHGVRRWLLGETMPSNEKIKVLAEWLGEAPQDLGFGEERKMSEVDSRFERLKRGIGYQDREIVEAFMNLPVAQRRIVREVILTFAREAEREREGTKLGPSSRRHIGGAREV